MSKLSYYIDLIDRATDGKLLDGPITNATEITYTRRIDRAGTFSATIPATEQIGEYLLNRQKVDVWWHTLAGSRSKVGRGIIDTIEPQFDGNSLVWQISGYDDLRELAWQSPGFTHVWNGVNGPCSHATALSLIAAYASGWTLTADPSPANNSVYYKGAAESTLTLLGEIANQCQNHFRVDAYDKEVVFFSDFDWYGLVATAPGNASVPNAGVMYISDLEEVRDSTDLITRIYPYGEDLGSGNYVRLNNCTRAAPSGYTLSTGSNYIQNDNAIAAYGTVSRYIQYNEIRRINNSFLDDQAVSNALYDVALRDLQQRSQIAKTWRLHLVGAFDDLITPGISIKVMYRKVINGQLVYNVDGLFNVLSTTIRLRPGSPPELISLDVSSVDRHPQSDGNWAVLSEKARQFR